MTVITLQNGSSATGDCSSEMSVEQLSRISRLCGHMQDDDTVAFPRAGPIGYDILLTHDGGQTIGDFGGLIQDFASFEEALNWVERAFEENYRLRIDFAGDRPFRWTLEKVLATGGFVEMFAAGNTLLPRRLTVNSVRYFTNAVPGRRALSKSNDLLTFNSGNATRWGRSA